LLTDDVEFYGPLSLSAEPRRGREAVASQLLTTAERLFDLSTLRRTYHYIIADGDKAAVRQSTKAVTLDGPVYENEYVFWYETRDGKVSRIEEHADSLQAARVLGLL
jgi:ketosteroid isomerase-like protein